MCTSSSPLSFTGDAAIHCRDLRLHGSRQSRRSPALLVIEHRHRVGAHDRVVGRARHGLFHAVALGDWEADCYLAKPPPLKKRKGAEATYQKAFIVSYPGI